MNTIFVLLLAFNIGNYPAVLMGGKFIGLDACKAKAQAIVEEFHIPEAKYQCVPDGKAAST